MTNPMAPADELMPVIQACPFCRSEAAPALIHAGGIEWAQVECVERECGAIGPTKGTEAEAITAWNTRASPIQSEEVVEAVARGIMRFNRDYGPGEEPPADERPSSYEMAMARAAIAAMSTVLLGGEDV
jgi:hypothetical protein